MATLGFSALCEVLFKKLEKFEKQFEKKLSYNFCFLRFYVKENSFRSLEGELFVNFPFCGIEIFLIIVEKTYVFLRFVLFFPRKNFHLAKRYPLAFITDFRLQKSKFVSGKLLFLALFNAVHFLQKIRK